MVDTREESQQTLTFALVFGTSLALLTPLGGGFFHNAFNPGHISLTDDRGEAASSKSILFLLQRLPSLHTRLSIKNVVVTTQYVEQTSDLSHHCKALCPLISTESSRRVESLIVLHLTALAHIRKRS